jgi:hypothetical protein
MSDVFSRYQALHCLAFQPSRHAKPAINQQPEAYLMLLYYEQGIQREAEPTYVDGWVMGDG